MTVSHHPSRRHFIELLLVPRYENGVLTHVLARTSDGRLPIINELTRVRIARNRLQDVMRRMGLPLRHTPDFEMHEGVEIFGEARTVCVAVWRGTIPRVLDGYDFVSVDRVAAYMNLEQDVLTRWIEGNSSSEDAYADASTEEIPRRDVDLLGPPIWRDLVYHDDAMPPTFRPASY